MVEKSIQWEVPEKKKFMKNKSKSNLMEKKTLNFESRNTK